MNGYDEVGAYGPGDHADGPQMPEWGAVEALAQVLHQSLCCNDWEDIAHQENVAPDYREGARAVLDSGLVTLAAAHSPGLHDAVEAIVRSLTLFADGRRKIVSEPPSDDAFNRGLRHAIDAVRAVLAADAAFTAADADALARWFCRDRYDCPETAGVASCDHGLGRRDAERLLASGLVTVLHDLDDVIDELAPDALAADPEPADATAVDFATVLRQEAVRRVDDFYVHHALIRNQMREMADRIERWERGEFQPAADREQGPPPLLSFPGPHPGCPTDHSHTHADAVDGGQWIEVTGNDQLPLLCRLQRHGWKRTPVADCWVRTICRRCKVLEVPPPGGRP